MIAKKRNLNWIIRYVWQGKPQNAYEKRNGYKTLLPIGPSLDASNGEWVASENPTPFDSVLATDSVSSPRSSVGQREACIEAFYDIVVDIVSNQMGLTRRRYHTAHKDAKTLVCVLRSKNTKTLMSEFDCNLSGAYVRLQKARQRLSAFLEQKGEEVVAQMYQGPKTWCDARAREEFAIKYVAEQQAVYETKKEKTPPDSAIKRWKRKARALWEEQEIAA